MTFVKGILIESAVAMTKLEILLIISENNGVKCFHNGNHIYHEKFMEIVSI